jgi:hypothetical protein
MGLTFAYMPLRTYTRLAEYGLQICRAAIGGQIVLLERRRPRQSCTCGQCGHPCYATGRDVGGVHAAVCRRRVSPTMLHHAVCAAATQNILRSHSWAATWHDARCVYPLQVQEHYSGDYSDGGWMSRPLWSCGPLVVRRGRMHDAMACQQSGGFGRATTAT